MTLRTLFLLRHAKSSRDNSALADFDRPLAPRGRKAAPMMGAEMATRQWLPDTVLVSPAARTRQTWALVAPHLPGAPEAAYPESLYMGGSENVLEVVRAAPDTAKALLVIGHNPGLEEFAAMLAGEGSEAKAAARMRAKFPTAGLARFEFDGAWRDLSRGAARLTDFLRPKDVSSS